MPKIDSKRDPSQELRLMITQKLFNYYLLETSLLMPEIILLEVQHICKLPGADTSQSCKFCLIGVLMLTQETMMDGRRCTEKITRPSSD